MPAKPKQDGLNKPRGWISVWHDRIPRFLALLRERNRESEVVGKSRAEEEALAAELAAMRRLHQLATRFVREGELDIVLEEIVEAAIAITGADAGNLQLLDQSGLLKIAAQRGFEPRFLDSFNRLHGGSSDCGTAPERGERVVVEDVARSPIFAGTAALEVLLDAGVRAVQSTPLIDRSGRLLGMLSTHYRAPHVPDQRALPLLDLLARQAADIIERTQAEVSLRQQARLLDLSYDATFVWELDGSIMYWNQSAERLYGFSREEAAGNASHALLATAVPTGMDALKEALDHNGTWTGELRRTTKDGRLLTVESRMRLLDQPDGRRIVLESDRDITERKLAERALQASLDALAVRNRIDQILLTRADDEMYADLLYVLLDLTQSKFGVFGYIDEEGTMVCPSMTRGIWDQCRVADKTLRFPKETWNDQALWSRALLRKQSQLMNSPGKVPEGHLPITRALMVPILHHDELIAIFQLANKEGDYTQQDVLEIEAIARYVAPALRARLQRNFEERRRSRTERALRESEERLALAAHATQIGMFDWNVLSGDVLWTPQHEILFGFAPIGTSTVVSRSYREWAERLRPDDLPLVEGRIRQAMAEHQPLGVEYRVIWPDGSLHWIDMRGSFYYNSEGRAIRMIGVVMDVSDRKRAEEALIQAKAAAEAASMAKSQFLANISHELRTPMNAILGMINVALPKTDHPVVKDCLETAKGSADLLLTLLNDLLDCSRIEAGKLELESAPFSLRGMLSQITAVLSMRASEKGLRFRCRMPDEVPDALVGDRMRLQQVLLNLAGNAIKFTEHGEVEVCLRSSPDGCAVRLEFAVRDTGIGIRPSGLERLFQPFFQADASMTRRFGGTGLGLSISKSLVELMGGRIWAESEVGKGSSFYFTVSLPPAKEPPADVEARFAVSPAPHTRLCVLLVEDNPTNQKLAAYILEDRGHIMEIARNGQEAIRLTRQKSYDLILMDVQMPGMDGFETTAAIRSLENGKGVPIIAMTAHAMKGDRERCLQSGMDAYLSKPINRREMIALVESLGSRPVPKPEVEEAMTSSPETPRK